MVANAYYPLFDTFTRNYIRHRAQRLVGRLGLTMADVPDIEQELAFNLVQRLSSFDARKSPRQAFIVRVVSNMVVTIARRCKAGQRDYRRVAYSLDEITVNDDDEMVAEDRLVTEDEKDLRLRTQTPSPYERIELQIDLARVLGNLPEPLRAICEQLMVHNPTRAARNLGIPRTTLYSLLPSIRRAFIDGGLRDYLFEEQSHFA